MSLADTYVAATLDAIGLSYGDEALRSAYLSHCYPGDTLADARSMGAVQSACMLHARGGLVEAGANGVIRWGGKQIDILRCPYAGPMLGRIEEMLLALGKANRVLEQDRFAVGEGIQASDILGMGYGSRRPTDPGELARWLSEYGGLAHGSVVTGVEGVVIECGDGGQPDPKNGGKPTAIRRVERTLERRANGWWLSGSAGPRRITWRLRAADLPCL